METATLTLSYALALAFIVAIWLGVRGHRILKIVMTLSLPVFYYLHWMGLNGYAGWPSTQILPEKFELIAADVKEPDKEGQSHGSISLWIRPQTNSEPRAHIMPYSRKLHQILHETKQKIAAGRRQLGIMNADDQRGPGANLGNGRTLHFINAPRTRLPPKD